MVDPRGLVTPHHNGWSLDAWLVTRDDRTLVPSRTPMADQRLDLSHGWLVETDLGDTYLSLNSRVYVERGTTSSGLVAELRGRPIRPDGGLSL